MSKARKIQFAIMTAVWIAGIAVLFSQSWQIGLGVILLMWANNIQQNQLNNK